MRHKLLYAIIMLLAVGLPSKAQTRYTLNECMELAVRNNAKLRSARNQMEMSTETRREAYTKYFPRVSANLAGYVADDELVKMDVDATDILMQLPPQMLQSLAGVQFPNSFEYMKKGYVMALSAMQPLFAGGQIYNGNKLAQLGEEVSRIQLAQTEDEVRLTTAQFFWQIAGLKEKLHTLDAVDAQLASVRRDAENAIEAGLINRNDLLQVQLKQNEMKSKRLTLNNAISICQNLLSQYMGLGIDGLDIEVPSQQDFQADPQANYIAPSDALVQTHEYALLQKNVEAKELQRRMEFGKNLPSLAIGASLSRENLMDKSRNHLIGLATLSVPITDWWGGKHNNRKHKLAVENARIDLKDKSELLKVNMKNKWNALTESNDQIALARESVAQAEENLRLQRDYYQAGTCTMSDLMQAQTLVQQAHDQLTESITQYHIHQAEYQQACGANIQ